MEEQYRMQWPVLLINFRRPELTRRLLSVISEANPPALYFFRDGPRDMADYTLTSAVGDLALSLSQSVPTKVRLKSKNLGCRVAVEEAVSWFLSENPAGIILEDDCLPSREFFSFADQMLSIYYDSPAVWMVSGVSFVNADRHLRAGESSHTFDLLGGTWGWATWRRAWQLHSSSLGTLAKPENWAKLAALKERFPFTIDRIVRGFISVRDNGLDTWDYQWAMSRLLASGLTVVPLRSLVTNVGFGPGATHTTQRPFGLRNTRPETLPYPLRPQLVSLNEGYAEAVERRDLVLFRFRQIGRRFRELLMKPIDGVYSRVITKKKY